MLDLRFGAFPDLEMNLRRTVDRLRTHAWLRRGPVHGLIFDVATGRLQQVV
jgi:carbonic anhydrase